MRLNLPRPGRTRQHAGAGRGPCRLRERAGAEFGKRVGCKPSRFEARILRQPEQGKRRPGIQRIPGRRVVSVLVSFAQGQHPNETAVDHETRASHEPPDQAFAVCPSQFPSAQEPCAAGNPEACVSTNVRTGPLTASRIVRLSVPRLPAACHPDLSLPGWYGSVRVIGVRAISSARFGKRGPDV